MQQEKIDLAPQPRQASLRRALQLARREMTRPDFGGDEHVAALDAGCAQPLPTSRSLSYISAVSTCR